MWWWLTVALAWAGPVVVVVDGAGVGESVSQNINQELELLGSTLSIAPEDVREGEPTIARILADLQRASARRDIEMVLAYGPLASLAAHQLSRPRVPVVAAMDLSGEPPPPGVIALPMTVDLDAAVDTMRRIVGGDVVLVAPEASLSLGLLPENTLPVAPALDLPEGVAGIVVLPLVNLSAEERATLFGAWAEQGIPSLALGGDLRSGATVVLTRGDGPSSIARRAALTLTTIEQGRSVTPRAMRLEFDTLRISALALEALGLSPPFDILAEAEVVGWRDTWPVLSLDEAVASAFADSPSLEATRQSLAADNTDVQQASANFLPQAQLGLSVAQLNDNVTFGLQGNQQFTGELSASQLFYDNQAMMNLFLQRDLRTSRSYEFMVAEQDLSFNLTSVYIGLLRAQGLLDIRRADLDRVQSGLEVARDRLRAGDVAVSEVARWEAEVASARAALVSAWMDTLAAMISVNQLRGAPALFRFQPQSEEAPPLLDWLASPEQLERLAAAVSEVAQRQTPSLEQYDALVMAQERFLRAARRAYYMPQVAGSVTLNGNLAISEPTSPLAAPAETP
ncbi:MAG: TolC family protein, partial [Myxococcota bacterium]